MSTTSLITTAIHAWQLPATVRWCFAEEGRDGTLRLEVPAGDVFYLKRHPRQHAVVREHALLCWLRERRLPTAPPVPATDGALAVPVGDEVLILYTALPGDVTHCTELVGFDDQAFGYGAGCARLQQALAQYPYAGEFRQADLAAEITGWVAELISAHADELPPTVPAILPVVGDFLHAQRGLLPEQLIHRDFHLSNILMAQAQVVGYVDFDLACRSLRLFDPCYALTGMLIGGFTHEHNRRIWPTLVARLFAGYFSVQPLLEHERRAVVETMLAIQLLFVAYGYRMENPALAQSNVPIIPWLCEHRQEIEGAVDEAWELQALCG